MKQGDLNFRHLYYFWVVAKEGGVTRAAERLGLAVQTISTQLSQLEQQVGTALFTQQGRRLVMTEAGRTALQFADKIFMLGEQLQEALSEVDTKKTRLTVGISDSLPKLSAYRMLESAMQLERKVRLVCYEDQFESLLADLALHKLDVVLTDRAVRSNTTLNVFSHLVFDSATVVVGTPALATAYSDNFPRCLNGAPFLLPTRNNALRPKIDEWFTRNGVRPDIVGEFEDNALLNTFGRRGLGLFFATEMLADAIEEQFGAVVVGDVDGVREQFYAISSERKIEHPAVAAILAAAQASEPAAG
jgi:LysR family transcriptional activator of nhaA